MNLVILAVIIYSALYDLRENKIPNIAVIILVLLGLTQATISSLFIGSLDFHYLTDALIGFIVGLLVSIILHYLGLFGAGDAKLLAALGIVVGFPNILLLISMSVIFSGALSLLLMICKHEFIPNFRRWVNIIVYQFYQSPKSDSIAVNAVPMGGAILLATLYCEFYMF
ncbi:A24 family peptidase [Photobacterium profundum]|uniref:A24 family peptidase n=1 Tax=Photobacterium profundum TaxID=74109 RepID=UPI003D0AEACD